MRTSVMLDDRLTVCLLVAATSAAGCGGGEDRANQSARSSSQSSASPSSSAEPQNVGSGALKGTRFVVPPIVSVLVNPVNSAEAGYTVYARLNRDLPRRAANGKIAAVFSVNDVRQEDPIGRLSRKRPNCFTGGIGFVIGQSKLPARPGSRVRVRLSSLDTQGRANGSLSMVVRLRAREERAANDYSPDRNVAAIDC
jgi:hypothetical protein